MTDAPLGTVRGEFCDYDSLQPILRRVADIRQMSREEIDRIAGFAAGLAGKVLAAKPEKRLGPDTLGGFTTTLGLKYFAVDDLDAIAKYTSRADQRDERYAKNAGKRLPKAKRLSTDGQIQALSDFARMIGRRGGEARTARLTAKQRQEIARKGAKARWQKRNAV